MTGLLVTALCLVIATPAGALQLGKWFRFPMGTATPAAPELAAPTARQLELELVMLASADDTPATLRAFKQLEDASPAPADLLRGSPELLDGRWSLLATVAASVGEDVSGSSARANVVNASGIAVEASKDTLPVQEVDVRRGRIGNEVLLTLLGQRLYVRVAGDFTPDEPPAPGTRAIVQFDSLDIFSKEGRRLFSAGWLFTLARAINPALERGAADASWLDTTYISDDVRLGRGNKGSVFVLKRLRGDGGGVLADWPL
jgi:hypothetical protein